MRSFDGTGRREEAVMWRLPKPRAIDMDPELPDRPLPAERQLMERWAREEPQRYRQLEKAGTALATARKALALYDQMELGLRAQNPGMTPMEADQHIRHVLSLTPRDPS